MKKVLFISILFTIWAANTQICMSQSFKLMYSVGGGALVYDLGIESAQGSEVVVGRLAHEVFVGTGYFKPSEVGPNPNVKLLSKVNDETRDVKNESWTFKQLSSPKGAYIIEQTGHKLVLTKRMDGRLLLKPYKQGDKAQLFRLERDTVSHSFSVYFKDFESDLVVTLKPIKLNVLMPQGPNQDAYLTELYDLNKQEFTRAVLILDKQEYGNTNQLWNSPSAEYFDMVFDVSEQTGALALKFGDEMENQKNSAKAQKYYERAYTLEPENYALCVTIGDRYKKYDKEKSLFYYERAYALDSTNAYLCSKLGLLTLEYNVEKGLKYCRKANENKAGTVYFEDLAMFYDGMAPVYDNGKYNAINRKGELLAPGWYDKYFQAVGYPMMMLHKDGKWRFINKQGEFIGDWFLQMNVFLKGLASVKNENKKWGVMDTTGNMIVPCEYKKTMCGEGHIVVQNDEDKYQILDRSAKAFEDKWYEAAFLYYLGNMAWVKENEQWRFMNNKGELSKDSYKNFKPFMSGVAFVQNKEDKWGAINKQGELVLPYQYEGIQSYFHGMAVIKGKDGKFAIINNAGEMLSDDWYDEVFGDSDSFVAVKKGKKWIYFNAKGEQLGKKYSEVKIFAEGFAFVKKLGKWGIINEQGDKVWRFMIDDVKSNFSLGRALVEIDGKTTYINIKTKRLENKKLLEK